MTCRYFIVIIINDDNGIIDFWNTIKNQSGNDFMDAAFNFHKDSMFYIVHFSSV